MTHISTVPSFSSSRRAGLSRHVLVIADPRDSSRDFYLPEPVARHAYNLGRLDMGAFGSNWEYCLKSPLDRASLVPLQTKRASNAI